MRANPSALTSGATPREEPEPPIPQKCEKQNPEHKQPSPKHQSGCKMSSLGEERIKNAALQNVAERSRMLVGAHPIQHWLEEDQYDGPFCCLTHMRHACMAIQPAHWGHQPAASSSVDVEVNSQE